MNLYKFFSFLLSNTPKLRRFATVINSLLRTRFTDYSAIDNFNKRVFNHDTHSNKRILIAGSIGSNPDLYLESLIGSAFINKGFIVDALLCDGLLDSCFNCKFHLFNNDLLLKRLSTYGPGLICKSCFHNGKKAYRNLNFNIINFSTLISFQNINEINLITSQFHKALDIKNYKLGGINIGEQSYAGAVRFFASPFIENEKYGLEILKQYFTAALKTYFICQTLFTANKYDAVIVNHGIYVPQGIIAEYANKLGLNVNCWSTGYRNKSFIFSKSRSYHFTILDDYNFESKLIDYNEKAIIDYLFSRRTGRNDWVLFHEPETKNDVNKFLSKDKLNIVLFTNVLWDAQVHFTGNIFSDMIEWLEHTINYFYKHDNVNLIVRIHPGEVKGFVKSRVFLNDILNNILIPNIKNKITIINSDFDLNSYHLAEKADYNIVYSSKIGIELAALGLKILVAGECWTKNKNITFDPLNIIQYNNFLDLMIIDKFKFLNFDQIKAKKFAYYLFFECMKEVDFIEKKIGNPPYKISKNIDDQGFVSYKNLIKFIENE